MLPDVFMKSLEVSGSVEYTDKIQGHCIRNLRLSFRGVSVIIN